MLRWKIHRFAIDWLRIFPPFTQSSRKRALFLSVANEISYAQIFPFINLADHLDLQTRELPIQLYRTGRNPYAGTNVDFVFLQTWFDLPDEQMNVLLDR